MHELASAFLAVITRACECNYCGNLDSKVWCSRIITLLRTLEWHNMIWKQCIKNKISKTWDCLGVACPKDALKNIQERAWQDTIWIRWQCRKYSYPMPDISNVFSFFSLSGLANPFKSIKGAGGVLEFDILKNEFICVCDEGHGGLPDAFYRIKKYCS